MTSRSTSILSRFTRAALQAVGVPENGARTTAEILIATDLRGIESHGVAHLADFYVAGIRRGHINPRPEIKIVSESPATAVLDGDSGLGFVVGHYAVAEAMRRARQMGVGVAAVRNSSHYGAGFSYALMAVPHDMVGISLTTGGNLVIPPGGVKPAYGVNVISVAAPTGRSGFPYVLDMATSVVAVGKLEIAARRGLPIPEGWARATGAPLTPAPPRFSAGGALLPLGGTPLFGAYKGFGLALAVDVLSGALSGSGGRAGLRGPF